MALLLDGVTADVTGSAKRHSGPYIGIYFEGGFGGGTVTIQIARNIPASGIDAAHTDWATVATVTNTDEKRIVLFWPGTYFLRAVLAGATAPTLTVATG